MFRSVLLSIEALAIRNTLSPAVKPFTTQLQIVSPSTLVEMLQLYQLFGTMSSPLSTGQLMVPTLITVVFHLSRMVESSPQLAMIMTSW